MFKAKSIMKTDVITVGRQKPIYEAIRILVENNITGLPVVNDDMTLAGILSEKDVLELLYGIEDKQGSVEDFMTKQTVTFNEDDSLIDITECFIKNNFRRVPIVADGKLTGIISRKDIIAYILKLRRRGTCSGPETQASGSVKNPSHIS
ncbi:MAG: CBS domain-containing protein [Planctomycetota bacterium]|jgi:CBS domain-containing protein